jgi:hypothetical protein
MRLCLRCVWVACVLLAIVAGPAFAQAPAPGPVAADPDSRIDPLQPDFNLAALPTTLRLPRNRAAFRVTHRFSRPLGRGDFGDLLTDFLGFDSGAQIGLEFRYGLLRGTQIGVYRTSNRDIQIFGQQSLMQQKPDGHWLGLDVMATFEGANNMKDSKASAIALLMSHKVSKYAAFYVEPIFVANSNTVNVDPENNTTMIGLGGRLRIRPAMYLVGEFTPRVAGYKPGTDQGSFGVEFRTGGHLFQINFSNGFNTTLRQISQGGIARDQWFIGFNIARKFF